MYYIIYERDDSEKFKTVLCAAQMRYKNYLIIDFASA